MEIRNLMSFVQVAELNSFTKAARVLGYSQSTVSFQIKQLEEELNCLLFERINNTITLTERGRELLEYAHTVSRLTEEFNQSKIPAGELSGFAHILTSDSLCEDMMLTNYMDFHKKHPKIKLKFSTVDTEQMFYMLDHNEADIMMTLDNHIYKSDYIIAKEEPVSVHIVTGAKSPYAKKKELTLSELAEIPFLLTEKNMGYRRTFDKVMAQNSIEVIPVLEIGRTDIICQMLAAGVGASFLPDFVTQRLVDEGILTYLTVRGVSFDIWKQLIYHKNKWISRSLGALINYIKENEFGK
jgi:DNA-binding transcriptional LysR family regulator